MSRLFDALERAEKERNNEKRQDKVKILNAPLNTPHSELSKDLVVFSKPGSAIAEEFRFLRSRILRPAKGCPPRTILITSCLQGEGKTFVSTNLAVTIAKGLDEYVLLVDADLRRSNVHKIFGYHHLKKGLCNHLVDKEPLEHLITKTSLGKLSILAGGSGCSNPAELLSSKKMDDLIKELRDRYSDRCIIFDTSPIELTPEAFVLANKVDAIYLVVKESKTPRELVKSTIEQFEKERFKGIIFNGYEKRKNYYKKYSSYYYKSY